MTFQNYPTENILAIGLGGNIASSVGLPQQTLIEARPKIELAIKEWFLVFFS